MRIKKRSPAILGSLRNCKNVYFDQYTVIKTIISKTCKQQHNTKCLSSIYISKASYALTTVKPCSGRCSTNTSIQTWLHYLGCSYLSSSTEDALLYCKKPYRFITRIINSPYHFTNKLVLAT